MMTYCIKYSTLFTERWMIMPKTTRNKNNIKHGTIELVLLLLLQKEQKYGYQLSQELSDFSEGKYELKETTMYPTLSSHTKWLPKLWTGQGGHQKNQSLLPYYRCRSRISAKNHWWIQYNNTGNQFDYAENRNHLLTEIWFLIYKHNYGHYKI